MLADLIAFDGWRKLPKLERDPFVEHKSKNIKAGYPDKELRHRAAGNVRLIRELFTNPKAYGKLDIRATTKRIWRVLSSVPSIVNTG